MNLASCEFCGVVYDKDRIKYRWSSWEDEFLRYIKCPNCGLEIFYETGDESY